MNGCDSAPEFRDESAVVGEAHVIHLPCHALKTPGSGAEPQATSFLPTGRRVGRSPTRDREGSAAMDRQSDAHVVGLRPTLRDAVLGGLL